LFSMTELGKGAVISGLGPLGFQQRSTVIPGLPGDRTTVRHPGPNPGSQAAKEDPETSSG